MVVVQLEDLDNLVKDVGVLLGELADEALGTTEEGLLVALRGNKLVDTISKGAILRWSEQCEHTCFIMPARLGIWARMFSSKMV